VLDTLEIERTAPDPGPEPEDEVVAALRRDAPSSVEEIAARSGRTLPGLLARLGELELAGAVRRLPGPLFVRS
jgi:predicted Rossmann fold nucleotide-binding protein DprA/Smf involved in DNA uptake